MTEPVNSALATITGGLAGLPAPVKTSFFAAFSQLVGGLTAIPAAWLRRHAQAIEDVTSARTTVSSIVSKAVAEGALQDPMILQAAAEVYLPGAIRKAKNRVQVAQITAEHLADGCRLDAPGGRPDGKQARSPDDDWMANFMRFAEDASSERLQDLFGRILAGEILRPGTFSSSTLRAISELDQDVAADFSAAWSRSVGAEVDFTEEWRKGEWFSRWRRLTEAGLMSPTQSARFTPQFRLAAGGRGLWTPIITNDFTLLVHVTANCAATWNHIPFTRSGREIGSLLSKPDYEANIRSAALALVQPGVVQMDLAKADGTFVERIYTAPGQE